MGHLLIFTWLKKITPLPPETINCQNHYVFILILELFLWCSGYILNSFPSVSLVYHNCLSSTLLPIIFLRLLSYWSHWNTLDVELCWATESFSQDVASSEIVLRYSANSYFLKMKFELEHLFNYDIILVSGNAGDWTQSFANGRQAVYHLIISQLFIFFLRYCFAGHEYVFVGSELETWR